MRSRLLLISCLAFFACVIEEPDPIVGPGKRYLTLDPVSLPEIDFGQKVSGRIGISLPVDKRTPDVREYIIGFDDEIIAGPLPPDVGYHLDVTGIPDGEHSISLFVFSTTPYQGMLGLLDAPHRSYYTLIIVEQPTGPPPPPLPPTPPPAPTAVAVNWTNGAAVTWSSVVGAGVTSYIVRRHESGSGSITTVATINDSLAGSYTDMTVPDHIGQLFEYSVGATSAGGTTFSGSILLTRGTRVFPLQNVDVILQRPSSNDVIVIAGNYSTINVFSTASRSVIRSVPIEISGGFAYGVGVSPDGSKVYLLSVDPSSPGDSSAAILSIDATALTSTGDLRPPGTIRLDAGFAVGPGPLLYVLRTDGRVLVANMTTRTIVDTSFATGLSNTFFLGSSHDYGYIYLSGYNATTSRFDVLVLQTSGLSPTLAGSRSYMSLLSGILPNTTGTMIASVENSNTLEMMHPATLASTLVVPSPDGFAPYSYSTAFSVGQSIATISYSSFGRRSVSQFNFLSGQWQRRWVVDQDVPPRAIYTTPRNSFVMVAGLGSDRTQTWYIVP